MAASMWKRVSHCLGLKPLIKLSLPNVKCHQFRFAGTRGLYGGVQSCLHIKSATALSYCNFSNTGQLLTTEASAPEGTELPTESSNEEYHSIICDTEKSTGPTDRHEFQAETRQLLDIVAKSLYSDKEVFIRELISNSSDALEKLRYLQMTGDSAVTGKDMPLEIHIKTDENQKTFTIQDTGMGMTQEEMIENLGTIARSGSKDFLKELSEQPGDINRNIIGQFGVGFYSTFMVSDKVEVFSLSGKSESKAYKWTSDGSGAYEISEAEGVQRGTKIVIHLKGECYDFAKDDSVKDIIKKYSNFVGVPIFLNGVRVNIVQPLWTSETRDITDEMHEEFYRFIANAYDRPRYMLHYKTDAPLNIRALFYVPEYKPTLFDMSRETESGISLYSRKVMIMSKAQEILPKWLRFIKGVVDSEDIPLNLSRELLQDSVLIRKLRWVLTNRLTKFFLERSKKDKQKYLDFYNDYGLFFREGIVTTSDQEQREEIAKLLRFESSTMPAGERTSLDEYATRMKAGERTIYYFSAPSRELAETSPYYEAMKEKSVEVIFCFEPYDELVLMNLGQFDKKNLKSIESQLQSDKSNTDTVDSSDANSLNQSDADELLAYLKNTLGHKVANAKVTTRLVSHPCIITVAEMGAARHFLRTTMAGKSEDEKYKLLQPTIEINPSHPIIKKLFSLRQSDSDLARLVSEQIFDNAMVAAGLIEDPRTMLNRLNDLMTKALEKL